MKIPYINCVFDIADSYKWAHWPQYPDDVEAVYINHTARYNRREDLGIHRFVFFGLQAFLKQMDEAFKELFFNRDEKDAVDGFIRSFTSFLGVENCPTWEEVQSLHRLGYLPLNIWAVPEGTALNHRIPAMTVYNTETTDGCNYRWLPGFIETWYSASMWHMCTSATTSMKYRQVFDQFAAETSDIEWFTDFQGHDFSMRGLETIFAAGPSGAGHLSSFKGTDTILAVRFVEYYYPGDNGLIGTSVPATEHSVVCAGMDLEVTAVEETWSEEKKSWEITRFLDPHEI